MTRIRKWLTRSNVLGLVAVVALVAVGTAYVVARAQEDATKDQTIAVQRARITVLLKQNGSLETTIEGLTAEYTKLYREAKASGVTPTTVAPQSLQGAAGATGATGASGHDGRGVVSMQCASTGLTVTYSDGSTVNVGTCLGAAGKDGAAGTAGATGEQGVTGAQGATGATGPQGSPGTAGTNGTNGVGVSSVTCVATATGTAFAFALTDGSTQDVAGDCTPPTTPTPSPTPGGTQ